MQAEFWKFNKRTNSTKRPDGQGAVINISIRQNFTNKEGDRTMNVCSPTIFITDNTNNIDKLYNYMKMNGRYYFIREVSRGYDNTAILRCEIDSLATLKDDIANTKAFVAYSSSDYNGNIDDVRNHDTINVTYGHNNNFVPFPLGQISYILAVRGSKGLATCYLLTKDQLINIATEINDTLGEVTQASFNRAKAIWATANSSMTSEELTTLVWQGWGEFFGGVGSELVEDFAQYRADVKNSIVSLRMTYVSYDFLRSGASATQIQLGSYTSQILAYDITNIYQTGSDWVTMPILGNSYLKGDRFSSYGMYLPYAGNISIPADEIIQSGQIQVTYSISAATLDIIYTIRNSSGKRIFTTQGNAGAELFLATNNNQSAVIGAGFSTIKTAIHISSAIISGGATAVLDVPAATQSAIGIIAPQQVSGGGSISSAIGAYGGLYVETYCSMRGNSGLIGQDAYNLVGGPLFAVRKLGDLSGYCKCIDASIESNDLYEILYIANRQINNGFFIE